MHVKLISTTVGAGEFKGRTAEEIVVHNARVSSPRSDKFAEPDGLIKYCIKHGHWSIFEQANMTVEIQTSRAISAQILRHRSFSFQEFSQRYAEVVSVEPIELRKQGKTNRQVGDEVFDPLIEVPFKFKDGTKPNPVPASRHVKNAIHVVEQTYNRLIKAGVAKESARMILPMASTSLVAMNGTIRSWIHYIELRTAEDTQKEHREIAETIKEIFIEEFPTISKALGWTTKD